MLKRTVLTDEKVGLYKIFPCRLHKRIQLRHLYTHSPCRVPVAYGPPKPSVRVHLSSICKHSNCKAVHYLTIHRSFLWRTTFRFPLSLFYILFILFYFIYYSLLQHACLLSQPSCLIPCISLKVSICHRDTTDLDLIQEKLLKVGVYADT